MEADRQDRPLQRASGGVPPPDAFDNLPRRGPPNLPGRGVQAPPEVAEAAPAEREPAAGDKAGRRAAGKEPAPRKNENRSVNPVRRRRRRRVAAVAVVAVLLAAGVWFTVTTLFKIEEYALEGDTRYSLDEVVAVFGHQPGDGMYGFSAARAEERIAEELPYIETVSVRRRLPSTVVFKVQPAQEAYALETGDGYAILSEGLKVLAQGRPDSGALLVVRGLAGAQAEPGKALGAPQSAGVQQDASSGAASGTQSGTEDSAEQTSAGQYEALEALLAALDGLSRDDVDWVDVADPLAIKLRWQGRVTVLLGPKGGLDEKLAAAMVLLTDTTQGLIAPTDSGTLDMTYYLANGESYFRHGGP